jgi:serine/threonine-protein kinase
MLVVKPTPETSGPRTLNAVVGDTQTETADSKAENGGDATPLSEWPVIPGYRLEEWLGGGGGGNVYRAVQQLAGRTVAVKILAEGGRRTRFSREIRALAQLRHPNVVDVYEVGESSIGPFYSMELMTAGSLARQIRERGPLPPAVAAELVEKAARGVAAAHAAGILHRDLKPANVLIDANGEPKVADFGLAKSLDLDVDPDGSTADPATPSGAFLGTPSYMAYEQAAGKPRDIDAQTDVYGLGAVLYQALTGEPPYRGENSATILHQVLTEAPLPPRRLNPRIPAVLEAICLKALARKKTDRYKSVLEFAGDLENWRSGRSTIARPLPPVRRAVRWIRPRLRPAGAILVLLVAVAAILVALSRGSWFSQSADSSEAIEKIEAALDRGESATLIGQSGNPAWSRWIAQTDPNPSPPSSGEFFSMQSWGYAMLELVRDPHCRSFRLKAQVMHLESHEVGMAGLYVGRIESAANSGPVHQMVELSFNDILPPMLARRPDGKPFEFPDMDKTPVAISNRAFAMQGTKLPWLPSFVSYSKPLCTPRGLGKTGWRNLSIVVTPDSIHAVWENNEALPVDCPLKEMETETAKSLKELRQDSALQPWADAVRPAFQPRGGVGLFVLRGSAAFRNVTIEPLP